ncbi:MAG: PCYCGC domain-containing protein [Chloroflexi bacterium]|nr:PCYCGC domain-containing protein [Chloroflexota bacterium]
MTTNSFNVIHMRFHKFVFIALVIVILSSSLSACSSHNTNDLNMMPMNQMPAEVQSAPVTVQTAYQFAAANPDIMKNIPCYCGCGNIGHTSNYSCYVSGVDAKGTIIFDNHALGCSLCVDITQDVMRMLQEGKSPQDARATIDATYSRYGSSNIP